MGNYLGTEEAREPTAATRKEIKKQMETRSGAARKTRGAVDTETGDNGETTEAVRPMEVNTTQTIDPNDTRKAMKAAAMEAMKAIGEAAKALEAIIGPKNLINIAQDTGLNDNDKVYTTYMAYKDTINAKRINNEAKNPADHDHDPIGTIEGDAVGGSSTPGPHDTPGL